jgi:hypothetical protein
MNSIRPGVAGCSNNIWDIEVGVFARSWTYTNGFIGESNVERVSIGIRMYRHRCDTQFSTGPDNTDSYLTTVGN